MDDLFILGLGCLMPLSTIFHLIYSRRPLISLHVDD